MRGAARTIIGFESVCESELALLGAENIKKSKGVVTFNVKDYESLAKISYNSKTTSRVYLLFSEIELSENLSDNDKRISGSLNNIDLKEWFSEDIGFRVECERHGDQLFTSQDVEKLLGTIIISKIEEKYGYKQRVALDNPELIVYADIIDNSLFFGIDFCGFDTSKRDYHVFVAKTSIRGNVGACMALYAGVKKKKTILDPMSSSGTIAIEAAFISLDESINRFRKESFIFKRLKPLNGLDFEKITNNKKKRNTMDWKIIASDPILANVMSTSKNANIAAVSKDITTTRIDFEWLDTKLEKGNIDAIITKLPTVSRAHSEKDIEKIYKEFFYQAEYILKKDGKIVALLSDDIQFVKIGKGYKFKKIDALSIMIGKQKGVVTTLAFE